MKRTTVRIPASIHEKLRKESFETGLSQNEIIVNALQKKYKKDVSMDKNIMQQLEELVGEEFTLLEMDNDIQGIMKSESSIFDGETEEYIENGEFAYTMWEDEEELSTVDVNIHFKRVEENEDTMEILVEVTEIEEL